jgi:cellulose synthase/poly-beta-1,6-N-acetylglucosamine synthase-like glycosyltransferase
MDLLFISSLLLLLNILIVSIFDLRYLINIDRKIKIPKYKDLKNKENLFVIFPVKNEEEDVLIKKIEYLKNINNVYKNLTIYFIFLDDTELDKEKN